MKRHVILPRAEIEVDDEDDTLCEFMGCHNHGSGLCKIFDRHLKFRQTGVRDNEYHEPVGRYERCFECRDSEVKE